jgi:hypothetical protein
LNQRCAKKQSQERKVEGMKTKKTLVSTLCVIVLLVVGAYMLPICDSYEMCPDWESIDEMIV